MQTKASPQEAQQVRSHKKNAAKHINRAHAKDSDSDSERSEWAVGSARNWKMQIPEIFNSA